MEPSKDSYLREVFHRHILSVWSHYSTEQLLFYNHLFGLEEEFHTFFTHQMVSSTERMSLYQAPIKVRFTSSPYKHVFLRQLQKTVLPTKRVEVQHAIEEFCYYCLENIYQHAGTKGYSLLKVTDSDILLVFFDKGPGIADVDNDRIPDILTAIQPKTSLIDIGSRGMGLTKAIQQADDFHLYSNGYLWIKSAPGRLQKTEFHIRGVCVVARIAFASAIRQPRRYMMI